MSDIFHHFAGFQKICEDFSARLQWAAHFDRAAAGGGTRSHRRHLHRFGATEQRLCSGDASRGLPRRQVLKGQEKPETTWGSAAATKIFLTFKQHFWRRTGF